jgi:integrase
VSWTPANERILHAYLVFAGQYHQRTIEAVLASIRDFERCLAPKSFEGITPKDVSDWRDHLLRRGDPDAPGARSRSTVRHRASHVRTFLRWLVQQPGYRRLNPGLADYARLPKAASAALLQPPPRPYPSLEEALAMVAAMPRRSMRERRDRAIVAVLFLTGLRADTAASIRFGDLDPEARSVQVNARHVRSKNGKSLTVSWFPVGEAFEAILRGWIAELRQYGAEAGDALFTQDAALSGRRTLIRPDASPLKPWASSDPIRRAFKNGCRAAGLPAYTPHAARHFLKALGDELCRTEQQRDAWSKNLGHETRQITVSHYAKITDAQRKDILDRMRSGETETEEDLRLLVAYYEYRLTPGSPELERAQRLADARRARSRPLG